MQFTPTRTAKKQPSNLNRWSASGRMTPTVLLVASAALILGSYFHQRGKFHVIREKVQTASQEPVRTVGPGGQDAVTVSRETNVNSPVPEFTSMTLLPGRGFNLWQLTANLPGQGLTPLLASPPVLDALSLLDGNGSDFNGSGSTNYGAAFLAPFANALTGSLAPGTGNLQSFWQGQRLAFPPAATGAVTSTEGLLLARAADTVKVTQTPGGGTALASFHAGTFSGGWTGNTDMTVFLEMSSRTVDMTITAQNVGATPEPFGIGWHPHFAIPGKDRAGVSLLIPSSSHVAPPAKGSSAPTGEIVSGDDSMDQFFKASGTKLGSMSLDTTFVNLRSAVLGDGPMAEFRDPEAGYGLRMTLLTPNIKTLRVEAPADKDWVSLEPNMNYPDALGHEWDKDTGTNPGMVILQPGDILVWKVRLEIFPIKSSM